jgi:toxin ParE1/3/4
MRSCDFTPVALSDLRSIRAYIARANPVNALLWVEKLEAQCRHLAQNTDIGRQRPEAGEAVRSSNFGRYVIFYRPANTGVQVLRVLHQSRDLRTIFPGDAQD